jgi:sentrin-specific protease 1
MFPLNLGKHHWALSVYDRDENSLRYYDSLKSFYTYDSRSSVLEKLALFLTEKAEILDRSGETMGLRLFRDSPKNLPQQDNGIDCGVFACKYADLISRNLPLVFDMDVKEERKKMYDAILRGSISEEEETSTVGEKIAEEMVLDFS